MIWNLVHRLWFWWLTVWWAIVDRVKGKPAELILNTRYEAGYILVQPDGKAWKVIRYPRGQGNRWYHQVRPHKQYKKEKSYGREYRISKHDPGC